MDQSVPYPLQGRLPKPMSPPPSARWRNAGVMVAMALLIALVAFLFLWPVAMLFVGIFRTGSPGYPGAWNLEGLQRTFASTATYVAFRNSAFYAVTTTTLATLLGAFFAFVSTRTDTPGRWMLTPVMVLVFAAPNLLYAVSWGLLADPNAGLLNAGLRWLSGADIHPFNAYTWPGMILIQSLKLTGFAYLLLLGPFRGMSRTYEEASLVSGAGRVRTLFSIELPLLTPAIFGVVIIGMMFGLSAFDIPQILGGLANIPVLSTEIFRTINFAIPADYQQASALGLFMTATLLLLLVAQWWAVKRGRFATVTGRGYNQEPWEIGGWRYVFTAAIILFAVVTLLLPGIELVLTSFQTVIGINRFTLANYRAVLTDSQTVRAFVVTAWLALSAGFLASALALVMAFTGRRVGRWTERYLDGATLMPLVMPGVVLAVGLLWAYISFPGLRRLYGTMWLALIGLVVVVMPLASRAIRAGLEQISRELEEAASIAGASQGRVLVDVVLRLVKGSFLAAWLVAAVVAAGTLDVPLLLLPPTSPNVAVLVYSSLYASAMPTQASALPGASASRHRHHRTRIRPASASRRRRAEIGKRERGSIGCTGWPSGVADIFIVGLQKRGNSWGTSRQGGTTMMQKQRFIALGAAAMLSAFALHTNAWAQSDTDWAGSAATAAAITKIYDDAVKAGESQVIIYGAYSAVYKPLWEIFHKRFPKVEIVGNPIFGAQLASKLDAEFASGQHVGDVVMAGLTEVLTTVAAGRAQSYAPPNIGDLPERYTEPDHRFIVQFGDLFVMIYNTDKISPADAPKSLQDLLDPKFKGFVIDDPLVAGATALAWTDLYNSGKIDVDFMKGIKANAKIVPSPQPYYNNLATGGVSLMPWAGFSRYYRMKAGGAPVGYAAIEGAAVPVLGGTMILDGAPHLNAAKLFQAWFISPEAQNALPPVGSSYGVLSQTPDDWPSFKHYSEALKTLEPKDYLAARDKFLEAAKTVFP